jgi:hypothetical protein
MYGAPPHHPTVRVQSEGDRWSFVLLRHRTVPYHTEQSGAPLTSCSDFCRGTVLHCSSVRVDCCAQIAVTPLAHRTVRWIIAERACIFPRVDGWNWYDPSAPDTVRWHTGQSGAPTPQHTQVLLLLSNCVPNLILLLVCVEPYAPVKHVF